MAVFCNASGPAAHSAVLLELFIYGRMPLRLDGRTLTRRLFVLLIITVIMQLCAWSLTAHYYEIHLFADNPFQRSSYKSPAFLTSQMFSEEERLWLIVMSREKYAQAIAELENAEKGKDEVQRLRTKYMDESAEWISLLEKENEAKDHKESLVSIAADHGVPDTELHNNTKGIASDLRTESTHNQTELNISLQTRH